MENKVHSLNVFETWNIRKRVQIALEYFDLIEYSEMVVTLDLNGGLNPINL